jgi:hypothetical protein
MAEIGMVKKLIVDGEEFASAAAAKMAFARRMANSIAYGVWWESKTGDEFDPELPMAAMIAWNDHERNTDFLSDLRNARAKVMAAFDRVIEQTVAHFEALDAYESKGEAT